MSGVFTSPGTSSHPISAYLVISTLRYTAQTHKRVFPELGPVFQRRVSALDLVELDRASAELEYVFEEWR